MADQVRRDEKRVFEAVTPDLFRGRLFLKKKDPRGSEGLLKAMPERGPA